MEYVYTKGNAPLMRKLANLIESELKKQEICAVYNSQLARLWPRRMGVGKRKQRIKHFARQNELAVTFYDVGLCAIFEKARLPARSPQHLLFLEEDEVKHSRKRRG